MKNIKVISGEIDGADLRRKKARNRYYTACQGSKDNEQISEAAQFACSNKQFLGLGEEYDRIFRR